MPLASTGITLGDAIATAGGCDALGTAKSESLGTAMVDWIVANTTILPGDPTAGGLIGSGGAISGSAIVDFAKDETDLGPKLAAAITDPPPPAMKTAWTKIAKAIIAHMKKYGSVTPTGWTYSTVTGGTIAGSPMPISFATMVFNPLISSVIGVSDPPNLTTWDATPTGISYKILQHIASNAAVPPSYPPASLLCSTAGVVTGSTVIT